MKKPVFLLVLLIFNITVVISVNTGNYIFTKQKIICLQNNKPDTGLSKLDSLFDKMLGADTTERMTYVNVFFSNNGEKIMLLLKRNAENLTSDNYDRKYRYFQGLVFANILKKYGIKHSDFSIIEANELLNIIFKAAEELKLNENDIKQEFYREKGWKI